MAKDARNEEIADYINSIRRNAPNKIQEPARQWFVDYLPVTGGNKVQLLIDGEAYGKELYDTLMGLKKGDRLHMTGLHFDPYWALVRKNWHKTKKVLHPYSRKFIDVVDSQYTLLNVLTKLANDGVEIYMLVNQFWRNEVDTWDPIKMFIKNQGAIDAYMPKTVALYKSLEKVNLKHPDSPNVFCRSAIHPGFYMGTHHQKTVIINAESCFLGGMDLTAVDGDRWDNAKHEFAATVDATQRDANLPIKLWHDVHCKITGPAVSYVLDNFYARWWHGSLFQNLEIKRTKYDFLDFRANPDQANAKQKFKDNPIQDGVYPTPTRIPQTKSAFAEVHTRGFKTIKQDFGKKKIDVLPGTKIQIVRSMPQGSYRYGKQKPKWNLSPNDWERSCKDAYLVGIRAAQKCIYLENQWIPDVDIWTELIEAAKRNAKTNKNFRIVVMIPRDPLGAAGFGSHSTFSLTDKIKELIQATSHFQLGMFCVESPVPAGRTDLELSDADKDAGERAEIYIHSKIMIIDDKWSLIGSANAGGISLEGVPNFDNLYHNIFAGSAKSKDQKHSATSTQAGNRPDTEIAAIIFDGGFAKKFREKLWSEHLQKDVTGQPVHEVADAFHIAAKDPSKRIRYARDYAAVTGGGKAGLSILPYHVVVSTQSSVELTMARADALISLKEDQVSPILLNVLHPPNEYGILFRWALLEGQNRWSMVSPTDAAQTLDQFGSIKSAVLAKSGQKSLAKKFSQQFQAKIQCEVFIFPIYLLGMTKALLDSKTFPDKPFQFVIEKEVVVVPSFADYIPLSKKMLLFDSVISVSKIMHSRSFRVKKGQSIAIDVYAAMLQMGESKCSATKLSITLQRSDTYLNDSKGTMQFDLNQDSSRKWQNLDEGDYKLSIWPKNINTNPYCVIEGTIKVSTSYD